MFGKRNGLLVLVSVFSLSVSAQKIVYSEPERDDTKRMNFEVIGKLDGNFLIYKNPKNKSYISIYNNDMEMIDNVEQAYVPDDRLTNVDFFAFPDFFYMVYQYRRRNVIYCMAAKINPRGKLMQDPVELDSTHIGVTNNDRIYTVLGSEDKSKLMVFKVNSRNREKYLVTTVLYDSSLTRINRSTVVLPMQRNNEYLGEFHLDNEGDLIFAKFRRENNDNIGSADFVMKAATADAFQFVGLNLEKIYLDEMHIKVDNYNQRYFITSFYYESRRGNIEGFYFYVWDKKSDDKVMENTLAFTEQLKQEARGDAGLKAAFNDYFIRNVIIKKDGGFIISSESYYTTSRYSSWNRWNYLYGNPYYSSLDYYYYSPYYFNNWWWNRDRFSAGQNLRFHADNIVIFSFNRLGNIEWSNVIKKDQFDDESDNLISYQLMNTGSELHFLFNQIERRALLLNDFAIVPGGKINRNPTLKNLDRGYEFMAKYGKQVSINQAIIPCFYRNYICFAKLEYN